MGIIFDQRKSGIITSVISIIIGTLLALMSIFAFDALLDIFFTCVGLGIIFVNIIPLALAVQMISKDKRYLLDLIFSIIAIVLGALFIFEHGKALSIVFSIYLVIMPITRIVLAPNKRERLKKELPLFIIAVLLFFNILGPALRIALIAIGAIIAILGIVNLIMTLINNKNNNDIDDFNNNNSTDNISRVIIDADVKDL